MPSTHRLSRLAPLGCLVVALLSGCAGLTTSSGTAAGAAAAPTAQAADAAVVATYSKLGFYPASLGPHAIRLDLPSNESFASGSAEVPASMKLTLDTVAGPFNSPLMSGWQLLVVGHADDRGDDKDNEVMSLARADGVARHLVSRGTDASRVRTEGHGEREPLATNARGYGRELNRRVELFLHRGPLPASATTPR